MGHHSLCVYRISSIGEILISVFTYNGVDRDCTDSRDWWI